MSEVLRKLADAKAALEAAKKLYAVAEAEAISAYDDNIKSAYADKGIAFGVANIVDGETKIKITTPKTVSWDQEKLAELYSQIKAGNENPDDYIKVEFSVAEAKFDAWPEAIKDAFIPARTVKPGKVKLEIVEN